MRNYRIELPKILLLATLVIVPHLVQAQNIRRLTFHPGQDVNPVWDPASNTIAYMRSKVQSGVPFDIYAVQSDGTGEGPFAIGPSSGFGLANSLSWRGVSRVLGTEERVVFHEYLAFDSTQAPFTRTVSDGGDAAFFPLLQINGGGGGGLLRFSRFGNTALVRFSAVGGGGLTTIRTGAVSELTNQSVSTFGTIHVSEDTGTEQKFLAGAALNPDGTQFVLAMPTGSVSTPHDLIRFQTDGSGVPVNLTNNAQNGVHNIFPDISPDGTKIAFTRITTPGAPADLFVMNMDGSGVVQLTNTTGLSESFPSWSQDGTQIAFTAAHLAGRESDFPALLPGEAPNSNIYVMDVELSAQSSDTVTPTTVLDEPPIIIVSGRTATFTFELFLRAKLGASSVPFAAYGPIPSAALARKGKIGFRYELLVERTADTEGSAVQNDIRRKLTKRNSITLKDLTPGNYTAKYRVQITKKKKNSNKLRVVATTDFSPAAQFTIGS